MATPLSAFTTQLLNFVDDLAASYRDDADIRKAAAGVALLKRANPKLLHAKFVEVVVREFRGAIMAQDETAILARSQALMAEHVAEMAHLHAVFHRYWSEMTPENQAHVWDYLKVLVVLAERVPPA
jgi:hypothetical protein